jgi:hypothetical protein
MPEGLKGVNRGEPPTAAPLHDAIARRKNMDMSDENNRERGYRISLLEYMKWGGLTTVASFVLAAVYLWLRYLL